MFISCFNLTDDLVKDVHFSGGMLSSRKDGEKTLSFKEKMSDIISRSKAMKAERQLHQEEIKNIVQRLDNNWQMTMQKLSSEVRTRHTTLKFKF